MLADIIADEPAITDNLEKNGNGALAKEARLDSRSKRQEKQEPQPLNLKETIRQMRAQAEAALKLRPVRLYGDMDEVIDHLYLSGITGRTLSNIRSYKLRLIVNASVELSTLYVSNVENVKLWVSDLPCTDLKAHFDAVSDKIESHLSQGHNVLVHCQAGISRSTTVVLAYLMKHKGLTLREAHHLAKKCRPMVRPNPGFWNQLKCYEKELTGRISVDGLEI